MNIPYKIIYVKLFILFSFYFIPFICSAQLNFKGNNKSVIQVKPAASTGLNDIYIVDTTDNLTISFQSSGKLNFEWLIYGNLGGGYAQPVEGLNKNEDVYSISNPIGNKGYIIHDNEQTYSFWLVDYKSYQLKLESLSVSDDSDCDMTVLDFIGEGSSILYYTINGRQETLNREITLSYNTLQWDESEQLFIETCEEKILSYVPSIINIYPAVYCQTEFVITGDRFLKEWGEEKIINTDIYNPIAVDVRADMVANNADTDSSNQIGGSNGEMGSSAPYDVTFYSFFTDAVVHYEWQISSDPEFEDITYRIYEQDLNYVFNEDGNYYVRFIGSNSNGSCTGYSDYFTISIGASKLLIPNVFSPNGDGINDVWRVAYKSLIEFKCWIFNRHGHQIYYYEDPSGGWDGKNGSKFVNPGVYFYVIEALGADGKKYKKSGDINILKSINTNDSSLSP